MRFSSRPRRSRRFTPSLAGLELLERLQLLDASSGLLLNVSLNPGAPTAELTFSPDSGSSDDSGDGSSDPGPSNVTTSVTDNGDGTYSLDIQITDSEGDPAASGPVPDPGDSNFDPASIPNGGSDSIDIMITVGPDSITAVMTQNLNDSYSLNGTMSGGFDSGTWTLSGSDSLVSRDTFTLNSDGTTSETYSLDTNSWDRYSFTDSGTIYGADFTLSGGGKDSSQYHDDNGTGGGGADNTYENDSSSQNIALDELTADGAWITAGENETVGYINTNGPDASTPGQTEETTTNTDVGGNSSTYLILGSYDDGGSAFVSDIHSGTFNDSEVVTTTNGSGEQDNQTDDKTDVTAGEKT